MKKNNNSHESQNREYRMNTENVWVIHPNKKHETT